MNLLNKKEEKVIKTFASHVPYPEKDIAEAFIRLERSYDLVELAVHRSSSLNQSLDKSINDILYGERSSRLVIK